MMGDENQDIKIIGVDKEAIKIGSDKKDFWVVPFKLSFKPDQSWERKFYEVQQKETSALKRRARVHEDVLRVEVTGADELQKILDVIKAEVTQTNALCEEEYQKKLLIRQELEDLQRRDRDSTQKFKEEADKLQF